MNAILRNGIQSVPWPTHSPDPRNAFRTQDFKQNIATTVVFVTSVGFIAYELTLDARRLLIPHCRPSKTRILSHVFVVKLLR